MTIIKELRDNNLHLLEKARKIKLVLTDNDGVLTDTGVYYSDQGEIMKRFSIRDGMGVVRLREMVDVDTGIITGELSGSVKKRADKLKINNLFLGVKDKHILFDEILKANNLNTENIAYIGDDINDMEIMDLVGLTASPADAMQFVTERVDFVCSAKGGNGAFREFAELIIALKSFEE